jgi:isopenicillin N synthase-like dioxygenase
LPAPELIKERRSHLSTYIRTNYTILDALFTSLSKSLGLEPSTFSKLHRLNAPSGCHVRFICAPPSKAPTTDETAALGEHTDFGSLTILFNRLGGLQVRLPQSQDWVYVKPVKSCAIVNLGDAMVKFSAGILRSNLHRVVTPPGAQAKHTRYSLVYFSRPEHDVVMKRLPGGLIDEQGVSSEVDKEPEVKTKDWILRRHLGRKIEYFTGPESWQNAMGTEMRDVVV